MSASLAQARLYFVTDLRPDIEELVAQALAAVAAHGLKSDDLR